MELLLVALLLVLGVPLGWIIVGWIVKKMFGGDK